MHKTDSFQRFSEVDEDEGLGRSLVGHNIKFLAY